MNTDKRPGHAAKYALCRSPAVASAAVVYLAMQLSMHVEWREALLAKDDLTDHAAPHGDVASRDA